MAVSKQRAQWWIPFSAVGAIVLVGTVVAVVPGCADHAGAEAEGKSAAEASQGAGASRNRPAVAVTVEEATVRPIQRAVQFVGNFVGYDEVTVMAEVTGRVAEVCHDVGDVVRPGEVLLKIDPIDYQLAVEETRRALELEATRLGLPIPSETDFTRAKILPVLRSLPIDKLPLVVRAREKEENARRKAERDKKLRDENNISEELYDQSVTDYEVARSDRVQAERDAQAVIAGIKHRLVLLQIVEEKLRRTNVVVPTPTRRQGMPQDVEYSVAKRSITEGEMLKDAPGSSTAVFDLVIDKVLRLLATAPEQFVGEVKVGQQVEIRDVEAYPGRTFEGTITRVSPVVDRVKHSFEIEALVLNPKRELKPGGYAKGAILTRVDPKAIVVPMSAAVTSVGSTKVFVVRDGAAHAVLVTTGVEVVETGAGRGSWVELVKPDPKEIRPGTPVITSGHNQLAEGSPVTIRQAEQPAGPEQKR